MQIIAALAAVTLTSASTAMAQYKPTGDDGVTASPRVRKALNECGFCARVASAPAVTVDLAHPQRDGIAASPKVRSLLAQHAASAAATPSSEVSTTRAPNDGIVASPKVRELLRGIAPRPTVELAPISR
jgi:hypothetical protein